MTTKKSTKKSTGKSTTTKNTKSTTKTTTKPPVNVTVKKVGKFANRFRSVDVYVFERKIDVYSDSLNIKQMVSLILGDRVTNSKIRNILSQYSRVRYARFLYQAIAKNDKKTTAIILHRWINHSPSNALTVLAKAGIRLRTLLFSISFDGIDRDSLINWFVTVLKYYGVQYEIVDHKDMNLTIIRVPVTSNRLFGYRKVLFINLVQKYLSCLTDLRDLRKRFVVSGPRS